MKSLTDCSTQNLLSRFHLIPRQSDPPESSGPFEPFKAIGTFDPFSLLVHCFVKTFGPFEPFKIFDPFDTSASDAARFFYTGTNADSSIRYYTRSYVRNDYWSNARNGIRSQIRTCYRSIYIKIQI